MNRYSHPHQHGRLQCIATTTRTDMGGYNESLQPPAPTWAATMNRYSHPHLHGRLQCIATATRTGMGGMVMSMMGKCKKKCKKDGCLQCLEACFVRSDTPLLILIYLVGSLNVNKSHQLYTSSQSIYRIWYNTIFTLNYALN